jgi:NUMOD4 motif-containing protein
MTIWQEIISFPGYSVSNTGLVRNNETERLLARLINSGGVAYVGITRDGEQHNRVVARLVAEAFLPPPHYHTFDTPINLDGVRTHLEVTNLMWRPRWFAVKYHQQFRKVWSNDQTVVDVDTGRRYKTAMHAAVKFGLLALDVFEWALMYDRYLEHNVQGVWPTYQRFRLTHTKARSNRRL